MHTPLRSAEELDGNDAQSANTFDSIHGETDRRRFLIASLAAMGTLGVAASEADAKDPPAKAGQKQAPVEWKPEELTVESVGEKKWKVPGAETERNGEGFRGPSMIPPRNFILEPIMLTTTVEGDGQGQIDCHILVSGLPRDIADARRLLTMVKADCTGIDGASVELRTVVSKPHNNAFLVAHVRGAATGRVAVAIRSFSWMSLPGIPPMQGDALLRQSRLPGIQYCGAQMSAVKARLKYNANTQPLDPDQIGNEGDCGSFAQMVTKNSEGNFYTAVGYSAEGIDVNGGQHAFNISHKGNLLVDAPFSAYGVVTPGHITTTIGTDLTFDDAALSGLNGPFKTYNGAGLVGGGIGNAQGTTKLSIRGKGVDGAMLAAQKTPPKEITDAHRAFVTERTKVNAAGQRESFAKGKPVR